ncbi:MAG: endolytic transglycosylase MltG [Calditerrivibrio sp.]|nr:endolytic transglycosylase MltG [Calditerrivibrio sp.]
MFFRAITILLIPIFVLSFLLGFWIYTNESFLENQRITTAIKIKKGEKFSTVYEKLLKGVSPPFLFDLYLKKVKRFPEKMKFGYYEADNITLNEFLKNIEDGKESRFKITIPEGFTINDIAQKLKETSDIDSEAFLRLSKDKKFITRLTGYPYPSLEGFIYPDTYFITSDVTAEIFIEQAYKNFLQKLPENFEENLKRFSLTFYEGLILASIVQKETYLESEYPIVSSVFINRLKLGMPLQSDPTIIYGLGTKFDGNLRKTDLRDENNIYNTYTHKGLPPTPICNPSIGALKGVAYPANTNYLYFVSKNDGSHIFAKDYNEHLNNIKKYQLSR